jgi:hypothetical protein
MAQTFENFFGLAEGVVYQREARFSFFSLPSRGVWPMGVKDDFGLRVRGSTGITSIT